jgi:hypothetical protein
MSSFIWDEITSKPLPILIYFKKKHNIKSPMFPREQNQKTGNKIGKTKGTKSLTSRPKIINGTLRHI